MEVDFCQVALERILHHIKKWDQMDRLLDQLARKLTLLAQIKNWSMVKEVGQVLIMLQDQSLHKIKSLQQK